MKIWVYFIITYMNEIRITFTEHLFYISYSARLWCYRNVCIIWFSCFPDVSVLKNTSNLRVPKSVDFSQVSFLSFAAFDPSDQLFILQILTLCAVLPFIWVPSLFSWLYPLHLQPMKHGRRDNWTLEILCFIGCKCKGCSHERCMF